MAPIVGDSVVFSGDGINRTPATISAPQDDYAEASFSVIVRGEMFIFGGNIDTKKANDSLKISQNFKLRERLRLQS